MADADDAKTLRTLPKTRHQLETRQRREYRLTTREPERDLQDHAQGNESLHDSIEMNADIAISTQKSCNRAYSHVNPAHRAAFHQAEQLQLHSFLEHHTCYSYLGNTPIYYLLHAYGIAFVPMLFRG
jgi:hypothetical protein